MDPELKVLYDKIEAQLSKNFGPKVYVNSLEVLDCKLHKERPLVKLKNYINNPQWKQLLLTDIVKIGNK